MGNEEKISRRQAAKKTYSWELVTFEKQGKLWLEWRTDAPFRAQKDKIEVYKGKWPHNPDSEATAWTWAESNSPVGGWNSGIEFGSDWYCARIAQKAPDGPYVYMEQIITKG
ncbi:hypothetical protein [Kordia sp.]|uniref:hypothetical protein n=1 Tax=Kordia sp. TaxID=1965332 RepID=UPI003D27D6C2